MASVPSGNKPSPESVLDQDLCCHKVSLGHIELTHWGRVMHICVGNLKARSHSALRLNHGQNPSKSGLPWSRRCCSHWCRVQDELQSIYRRGRTRGKIGTVSDAAKSFELLKILARGQLQAAHVVKTCNTCEIHVLIHVPAVIKTWGDAVRRESLGICHGQSTVIGRVLRIGITGNSVCLAAYHW